mmetsp:Transcript_31231/g.61649  ORF Transcript_31231/g.61649 Transcript_31231/m.61649 type:complete len:112 (+) Transcript_31231:126-461(+)
MHQLMSPCSRCLPLSPSFSCVPSCDVCDASVETNHLIACQCLSVNVLPTRTSSYLPSLFLDSLPALINDPITYVCESANEQKRAWGSKARKAHACTMNVNGNGKKETDRID